MTQSFNDVEPLAPNHVHVWTSFADKDSKIEAFEKILSADETSRANQFFFAEDRCRYIISRGTLRFLLAHYVRIPPHTVAFTHTEYGKPYLHPDQQDMSKPVYFNVSHSHQVILHAFTRHEHLGVDVEYERDTTDIFAMAKQYFTQSECEQIYGVGKAEQRKVFFRLWSHKEAFIKATGLGLSQPLDQFEIDLSADPDAKLRIVGVAPPRTGNWSIEELSITEKYHAALAIDVSPVTVTTNKQDIFR